MRDDKGRGKGEGEERTKANGKAGVSGSEKEREKRNAMVRGEAGIELKFRGNSVYRYLLTKIWLNKMEILL